MTSKQRTRGTEPLANSTHDTIALAEAIEERFLRLCNDYLRIKGYRLVVPPALRTDFVRWREMRVRHKASDFRNTSSELKSTREVAQWTVNVNAKLRHQHPTQIEWPD